MINKKRERLWGYLFLTPAVLLILASSASMQITFMGSVVVLGIAAFGISKLIDFKE